MAACECGARWGGNKTGHCTRCHRTFSTDSNFDRHLIIERGPGIYQPVGCKDPAELTDRHGNPTPLAPHENRHGTVVWTAEGRN